MGKPENAWFAKQLKAAVDAKRTEGAGMTEIAFKSGVSSQMLYAYLRGENQPKIGTYDTMAEYFGWKPLKPSD